MVDTSAEGDLHDIQKGNEITRYRRVVECGKENGAVNTNGSKIKLAHLGRLEWIVLRELDIQEEDASSIRGACVQS